MSDEANWESPLHQSQELEPAQVEGLELVAGLVPTKEEYDRTKNPYSAHQVEKRAEALLKELIQILADPDQRGKPIYIHYGPFNYDPRTVEGAFDETVLSRVRGLLSQRGWEVGIMESDRVEGQEKSFNLVVS